MFLKNSRYYKIETLETNDMMGRPVTAIKLRRLADTQGEKMVVIAGDQLDAISKRRYRDATRFWHIADANTELEANGLVEQPGTVFNVPKQ